MSTNEQICEIAGVRLHQITENLELKEAGVLWPCTTSVADVVLEEFPKDYLRGKRILEMGAGTGALGIAMAALGAHVTLTDLGPVVPLTETNVRLNRAIIDAANGSAHAAEHQWGTDPSALEPPFDVILCCETLYWGGWDLFQDDTRDAHLETLLSCSGPHTKIIVGFTVRDRSREVGFMDDICTKHFDCRLATLMKGRLDTITEGDRCLAILQKRS